MAAGLVAVATLASFGAEAYSCAAAPQLSIEACFNKHLDEALQRAKLRATRAQRRQQEEDSGKLRFVAGGTDLAGLASSLLNTLPHLGLASMAGNTVTQNAADFGMVINSRSLGLPVGPSDLLVQPAITRSPEVYAPVRQRLEAEGARDTLARIERELQPTDLTELGITFALAGGRWGAEFGRRSERYNQLFETLLTGVMDKTDYPTVASPRSVALDASAVCARTNPMPADEDCSGSDTSAYLCPDTRLTALDAQCLSALNRAYEAHARQREQNYFAGEELYYANRLDEFHDLISNAAQLKLQLAYAAADDLVSADVARLRASLEVGMFSTIGRFLSRHREVCTSPGEEEDCFDAYSDWLDEHPGATAASHLLRANLSLEYARIDDVQTRVEAPALAGGNEGGEGEGDGLPVVDDLLGLITGEEPNDPGTGAGSRTIDIHVPGADLLRLGLTVGYTLKSLPRDDPYGLSARLEAGGHYTWLSATEVRNRRWTAYVGIVFKAFGLSIPLQYAYVSDNEFRSGLPVDHERLVGGLRWDFL